MKTVLSSFALLFLTSTQLHAAFWRKKKTEAPKASAKREPRKHMTSGQLILKIDDLTIAISAKQWEEANRVADEILADKSEQTVIDIVKRDFPEFHKDVEKLFEDRKRARKEAREKALLERRRQQAVQIKQKTVEANVLTPDVSGIVAEYAVD